MDEENYDEENNAQTDEKSETIEFKDSALRRLDMSFLKHIEVEEYKKSNILAYWVKDFSNYHDQEKQFDPKKLKQFKRGDIVKVNLGFNIGNEFGGLHYCVVINKNDTKASGTLNVIPLSSIKEGKEYKSTCIDLGDELYNLLVEKCNEEKTKIREKLKEVSDGDNLERIKEITVALKNIEKSESEIAKMKHGSIALIHQITTISKQRIYKSPMLSKIKLSIESLDKIDEKIKKLFTK